MTGIGYGGMFRLLVRDARHKEYEKQPEVRNMPQIVMESPITGRVYLSPMYDADNPEPGIDEDIQGMDHPMYAARVAAWRAEGGKLIGEK